MNFSLKTFAALLVLALPWSQHVEAAGWYSGAISHVELTSLGEILLFLEGPANHECGSKRVDYVSPNDAPGRSILAALLSWQAQGKRVKVYISSCSGTTGLFNTVIDD